MSSEELNRQIPDELFQRVSAKPERALPDALFGPASTPQQDENARNSEGDDMRKAV